MVEFRIDVVVDPRRAKSGAKQIENSLRGIQNRSNSLRRGLLRTFGFLGGAALVGGAIRSLANFEQSLATVRAVSGATAHQFSLLREEAQRLGIETRFTAVQAADAMVKLARAGFSVDESLTATNATLNLAVAGGLDLASAADITASTLRGFRLEVDQVNRVTDVLTLTANSANTTVQQLGDALKFVAPIARGLNISLEETNAALGTLSDAGLKATLAGTGLRRVLAELESPTGKSQKILEALGVTADEVRVSQVGLVAAMERLQEAGIDTGLALQFFGKRGGPAFEVMVNAIPAIEEMTQALMNAEGVAKDTADIIDDSLNGAMIRATSAINGFLQALGEAGASSNLTSFFEGLAGTFRFFAANVDAAEAVLVGLAVFLVARFTPALLGMGAAARFAFPQLALLAAVATATQFAFSFLAAGVREANQEFDRLEDATFGLDPVEKQIANFRSELTRLSEVQRENGALSDAQGGRLRFLMDAISALRQEQQKLIDSEAALAAAREAAKPTLAKTLADIEAQIVAARDLTRESEIAAAAQAEIDTLLIGSQTVDGGGRKSIEDAFRRLRFAKQEREVLDELGGAQRELNQDRETFQRLLDREAISLDRFKILMQGINAELDAAIPDLTPFQEVEASLERQIESIQRRTGEQTASRELENALVDLKKEQGDISILEAARLAFLIFQKQGQLDLEKEITEERKRQKELDAIQLQEDASIQNMLDRLDATRGLTEQFGILNDQFLTGRINGEEFVAIFNELELQGLEASTNLEDGFTRAFIAMKREAEDLAAVGEDIVNVFANQATNALVEFAKTGALSIKDFARSVLDDLIAIIARLLVVQAIQAATGLGTGGGVNALAQLGSAPFASGRADGGTTQPNRSFLVGEDGPELFSPGRTGAITPNPASSQAAAPVVNVQVVNVDDPEMVPAAIADGRADEAILNVLARNPERVNQVIQ